MLMIAQVRGILDLTCLQSLQTSSRTMTKLTKLSQDENVLLLQLSRKASRDAEIIKILTLLTLTYLPASLVSVSTHLPRPDLSALWLLLLIIRILVVGDGNGVYNSCKAEIALHPHRWRVLDFSCADCHSFGFYYRRLYLVGKKQEG